jgi:hypothetical protein
MLARSTTGSNETRVTRDSIRGPRDESKDGRMVFMTNTVSSATFGQAKSLAEAIFAASTPAVSSFRVELDTRLIAAVQNRAGARCHESANLLHSYYMCADVYKSKLRQGNADASRAARLRFQESENRLREFLYAPGSASCCPGRSLGHACVA